MAAGHPRAVDHGPAMGHPRAIHGPGPARVLPWALPQMQEPLKPMQEPLRHTVGSVITVCDVSIVEVRTVGSVDLQLAKLCAAHR